MGIADYYQRVIDAKYPRQPTREDQQALMAALFYGAPQDQVNVTPRVTAPDPGSQALMNPGAPQVPAQPLMPNMQPMGQGNPQLAQRASAGAYQGPAAPIMQGPQADQLKALLGGLSPSVAAPMLSSLLQQQLGMKTPITVGKDSRLLQPNGKGGYDTILDAAPERLTPYQQGEQTQNDYNTLDKGSDQINTALEQAPWQKQLNGFNATQRKPQESAAIAAADEAARLPFKQQLADETDQRIRQRQDDASKIDLTDPSDLSYIKSIANYRVRPASAGRNPAIRKAQIEAALTINPDYQEAKFDQSAKALRDFGTGKQGDIARSLDVSVAHLDTLRELGDALDNGDITLINAAKQAFAEQFGVAAPTNFDAAKSIVADEVAKGVIGGQTAQADRETLAASLRKSGGPKVINGAINTFQSLLGGQFGGLRNQYKRTTGASDFDESFMSERTRKVLGGVGEKSVGGSAQTDPKIDDLLKKYGRK